MEKNPFEMQVHTSESKTHINTQKYCSQNMIWLYSPLKHNFYHITRNNFACEKVGQTLEFLKQYNDFLLQIVELIAPEFFIHLFKYSGYTEIYLFYTVCWEILLPVRWFLLIKIIYILYLQNDKYYNEKPHIW